VLDDDFTKFCGRNWFYYFNSLMVFFLKSSFLPKLLCFTILRFLYIWSMVNITEPTVFLHSFWLIALVTCFLGINMVQTQLLSYPCSNHGSINLLVPQASRFYWFYLGLKCFSCPLLLSCERL
jgi:hypothetical protein